MSGGIISSMMLLQTNLLPPKRNNLEAYTWGEISRIRKAGKASEYFKIGDSKSYSLSNNIKIRTYDAVILDIQPSYIVFATFPKTRYQADDALFEFRLHNNKNEKIDYTATNFFKQINTINNGLYIVENNNDLLAKYCLNIETSYIKVVNNNFQVVTNHDIKGPLYLPSFIDYNGTFNNINKSTMDLYDGYDNSDIFISKNYSYNKKPIYNFINTLQYGGNGSAYLLTRDIVGYYNSGSRGYATMSPNFESSNTGNPVSWTPTILTTFRKVQPFFYI